MVKALTLGNRTFTSNLIQGPLAGVSCAPFRLLATQHGAPAFTYTEMISCKTLLYRPLHAQKRFIQKDTAEGPVCFQLASTDPVELGEAVNIVTDAGADMIDLNCGCPVGKIRSKGAGSSLLSQPGRLHQLILAMKANTSLPVSVKIRVDGGSHDQFNADVANAINDASPDFVTVHGRHWTEHYETPCRHEQIAFFVEKLNMPVIGNGDVACLDSLKRMLATGCDGVMIGRAGVGQPWLTRQLTAQYHGKPFEPPTATAIRDMLLQHVSQLIALLGSEKFAILQARKFSKYYARHLPERSDFYAAVNQCESFEVFSHLCQRYFY